MTSSAARASQDVVWATGRPHFENDYRAAATRVRRLGDATPDAVFGVPLTIRGELVGVLGLAYLGDGAVRRPGCRARGPIRSARLPRSGTGTADRRPARRARAARANRGRAHRHGRPPQHVDARAAALTRGDGAPTCRGGRVARCLQRTPCRADESDLRADRAPARARGALLRRDPDGERAP